jgi:hypothetical protein
MEKAGKLWFQVRGKSAFHPAKTYKPTWLGEMETPSAIYVLLPQTVVANKARAVCGRASPQEAFWRGRIIAMTIRAELDCHA